MVNELNPSVIQKNIMGGTWKPNIYLTNLAIAQFQSESDFVATALFPVVPVQLPNAKYYKFSKADLARDNMRRKPTFGRVSPAFIANSEDSYDCKIDQLIMGIDQLSAIPYQRTNAPGVADPRRAKVRAAMEQTHLHLDLMFAEKYFKPGIWTNEYAGKAASPNAANNEFLRFDVTGADPIRFVDNRIMEIRRQGRRKVNKIALGYKTYIALKNCEAILDRVKYSGSSANPAQVSEKTLAELFGVEQVVVMASTYNKAGIGETENMQFICDETGMLMVYAPSAPQIDEPSAGYTFAWDMLGGSQYIAVSQFEGEAGTHSEFIETLCAYDMKQTGQDLACYCKDCVS